MKRVIATILAIVYLATATGTSIQLHFCMGKLVSCRLWHAEGPSHNCPACGMVKKKGCCEDQYRIIKTEKQYDTGLPAAAFALSFMMPYETAVRFPSPPANVPARHLSFIHSPPGSNKVPLYLAHCVYRV
jgi:hypothetical protein